MASKKLIYADEARKAILREAPAFAYCLDRVKAVDAVEVVRCKECKWCDERADFCTFWDSVRHPEHFCGEGERKDNG